MIAIRRFGVEPNAIETIFITHLHGDHFGGLPFFILDAQLVSRRTTPLTVAGPPGLRDRLREAMEVLFPGAAEVAHHDRQLREQVGGQQPGRAQPGLQPPARHGVDVHARHRRGVGVGALGDEARGEALLTAETLGRQVFRQCVPRVGREADAVGRFYALPILY